MSLSNTESERAPPSQKGQGQYRQEQTFTIRAETLAKAENTYLQNLADQNINIFYEGEKARETFMTNNGSS